MNNYPIGKWLGGVGVIAGGGILNAIVIHLLVTTAGVIDISAKHFHNYQALNYLLPLVTAVIFTVWWWRCVSAKRTIFSAEYKAGRTLNIIFAAVAVIVTELVIVACFVKFRSMTDLIIAAAVSCVIGIASHAVSSAVFGEY